jgi:LacI family transcriptional regulator
MAVTMKQIADEIGISVVTVSKALRNHPDISRKTRALVLERVNQRGYRPNLTARSLVTGRSSLVGLLVPDLIHPFFAEVARSLAAHLRAQGLYLVICASESDPELERQQLEHLLSRRLDAILVAHVGADLSALEMIAASDIPLILLDREAPIEKAHFVGVNDVQVGLLATQHLIESGCKRIAHLCGPRNAVGNKRLAGYKSALQKAGILFQEELVSEPSPGDTESSIHGYKVAKTLLSESRRPDGIFCFSDPMAIGAMRAALEKKISIPKQLKIIGCGNLHYDDVLRVPLSSVDQKASSLGEHAASIIIDHLAEKEKMAGGADLGTEAFRRIVLRPRVVVRESSRISY